MADLDLKGEGDNSMPGNRRLGPDVRDGAPGGPRDMAKAALPESQSPVMQGPIRRKASETGAVLCLGLDP